MLPREVYFLLHCYTGPSIAFTGYNREHLKSSNFWQLPQHVALPVKGLFNFLERNFHYLKMLAITKVDISWEGIKRLIVIWGLKFHVLPWHLWASQYPLTVSSSALTRYTPPPGRKASPLASYSISRTNYNPPILNLMGFTSLPDQGIPHPLLTTKGASHSPFLFTWLQKASPVSLCVECNTNLSCVVS